MVDTRNMDVNGINIEVPEMWKKLDLSSMRGTVLLIGAPDTGKTTLAGYLFQKLCDEMGEVAYLDGDPGQGVIGPPATMSLKLAQAPNCRSRIETRIFRSFVGSVSPRGHMLQVLIGAWRLTQSAYQSGVKTIIYDTSGFVDPSQGGQALKIAKIDLLRPKFVIAIQKFGELEVILKPLRRTQKFELIELRPTGKIKPRQIGIRQQYRADKFASYYRNSKIMPVFWPKYSVLPHPTFSEHRLIAFEDQDGFSRALGIVIDNDPVKMTITVFTPLDSLDEIDTIRLGSIRVNPITFQDERL